MEFNSWKVNIEVDEKFTYIIYWGKQILKASDEVQYFDLIVAQMVCLNIRIYYIYVFTYQICTLQTYYFFKVEMLALL